MDVLLRVDIKHPGIVYRLESKTVALLNWFKLAYESVGWAVVLSFLIPFFLVWTEIE